jgi:hypothetical protein
VSDFFSFWEQEVFWAKADVAIIGSGIVGLSAAIELKNNRPDLNVVVFESGVLPHGASTRNAGFACFGSISELMEDVAQIGEEATMALVEKRYKGLLNLRSLLGDKVLEYESLGGFEVFDNHEKYKSCVDQLSYFNFLLKSVTGTEQTYRNSNETIVNAGFNCFRYCIENVCEGQLHPGKMIAAFWKMAAQLGIVIYNSIAVSDLKKCENGYSFSLNNKHCFLAQKIIIATNGFAKNLLPDLDIQPARGQVLVTSKIEGLAVKGAFHYDAGYFYFRNIGDRLLLGGGRNLDFEGEQTTEMTTSERIQNRLEQLLSENIIPAKKYSIEYRWSGIMGVGKTRNPIIQSIDKDLFCAVRMGGMGVAIGSLAGKEVANLVLTSLA